MEYFAGIDLHSSNSYIAIIDNDNKRVFKKSVNYFGFLMGTPNGSSINSGRRIGETKCGVFGS